MGGLKVTGGKTERIEKLIFVPAGKKDTNNLMLQFNLGKTSIANEVTISRSRRSPSPMPTRWARTSPIRSR